MNYKFENYEIDTTKYYSFYYHYMHYYPGDIVKVSLPGCLVQRTIELLEQDNCVIINGFEEISKEEFISK